MRSIHWNEASSVGTSGSVSAIVPHMKKSGADSMKESRIFSFLCDRINRESSKKGRMHMEG